MPPRPRPSEDPDDPKELRLDRDEDELDLPALDLRGDVVEPSDPARRAERLQGEMDGEDLPDLFGGQKPLAKEFGSRPDRHQLDETDFPCVVDRQPRQIDHILVSSRWKTVQNCRVYRSMEFSSDHRPVVATVAIKLRGSFPKKPAAPPRYNVKVLADPVFQQQYAVEVSNRFAALSEEESADWSRFKEAVNEAAAASIGTVSRCKNKEWISNKTWDLIERKREARLAGKSVEYKKLGKECKAQLRVDRQRWADEKADEGEKALSSGQAKDAFAHFRQLRASSAAVSSPILDATGALISDKQRKLQRWQEHFAQLLNRPPASPSVDLQQAASAAVEDPDISCDAPTAEEVAAALRKLKNGKAPGCCNIVTESQRPYNGGMADLPVPVHMDEWYYPTGLEEGNHPAVLQREG